MLYCLSGILRFCDHLNIYFVYFKFMNYGFYKLTVEVEFNFVENGKKGKKKLLRAGYQYCLHNTYKNGTHVWRCTRKGLRSNATLTMNSGNTAILRESTHSCIPDFSKNKMTLALDSCKKHCRTEWESIPKIYEDSMATLDNDSDFSNNTEVPQFSSIKDSL